MRWQLIAEQFLDRWRRPWAGITTWKNKIRSRFHSKCIRPKVASPLLKGETVQVRRLALEEVCWPNLPLTQIEEVVLIPAHMVCPNS